MIIIVSGQSRLERVVKRKFAPNKLKVNTSKTETLQFDLGECSARLEVSHLMNLHETAHVICRVKAIAEQQRIVWNHDTGTLLVLANNYEGTLNIFAWDKMAPYVTSFLMH